MTDPVVELQPTEVAVEPGGQTRVVVTVVNEGSIVEGYRVEVLDDVAGAGPGVAGPASWSEVLPAEGGSTSAIAEGDPDLTVYPGQQQSVIVVFSPPVGTKAPGGRCAFAVRVSSVIDPGVSTVVEGDMEIGKVTAVQARLVPVTSTGRWQGRHVVELSNWSNVPVTLNVVAEDPDRALGFLVHPDTVKLPVGASEPVRLRVRTRHPRLRGELTRLPFTVHAEPADGAVPVAAVPGVPALPTGVVVDGAFNQKPIATKGAVIGAGLALVAVAGLTAYGLMQRTPVETFAEEGIPPTPQGVSVEATGPESLLVSWAPVDQIEGYKLFQVNASGDAVGVQELDPGLGAQPVDGLVPDEEYCFSLVAVRGEIESPRSEEACQRTEAAAPDPTDEAEPEGDEAGETEEQPAGEAEETEGEAGEPGESGDPGEAGDPGETGDPTTAEGPAQNPVPVPPTTEPPPFAPGEWAAVLSIHPVQGSPGEAAANGQAARLLDAGVETVVIDTSQYPDLGWVMPGWLVVYEEAYSSRAEAAPVCGELQAEVNQPGEAPLIGFCDPPVQLISSP